jgi:hypothetical protein
VSKDDNEGEHGRPLSGSKATHRIDGTRENGGVGNTNGATIDSTADAVWGGRMGSWPARVLRLRARYVAQNDARTKAMALDALLRDIRWRPRGHDEVYVNRIVSPAG